MAQIPIKLITVSSHPTGINSQEYVSGTGSIGAIFTHSVDEIELECGIFYQHNTVGFQNMKIWCMKPTAVYITSIIIQPHQSHLN